MLAEVNDASGNNLNIRIGLHCGPAGGVIGVKKFIYDLWGDDGEYCLTYGISWVKQGKFMLEVSTLNFTVNTVFRSEVISKQR